PRTAPVELPAKPPAVSTENETGERSASRQAVAAVRTLARNSERSRRTLPFPESCCGGSWPPRAPDPDRHAVIHSCRSRQRFSAPVSPHLWRRWPRGDANDPAADRAESKNSGHTPLCCRRLEKLPAHGFRSLSSSRCSLKY